MPVTLTKSWHLFVGTATIRRRSTSSIQCRSNPADRRRTFGWNIYSSSFLESEQIRQTTWMNVGAKVSQWYNSDLTTTTTTRMYVTAPCCCYSFSCWCCSNVKWKTVTLKSVKQTPIKNTRTPHTISTVVCECPFSTHHLWEFPEMVHNLHVRSRGKKL